MRNWKIWVSYRHIGWKFVNFSSWSKTWSMRKLVSFICTASASFTCFFLATKVKNYVDLVDIGVDSPLLRKKVYFKNRLYEYIQVHKIRIVLFFPQIWKKKSINSVHFNKFWFRLCRFNGLSLCWSFIIVKIHMK